MFPSRKADQPPRESDQREKNYVTEGIQLGRILRCPNFNFLSLVRFLLVCLKAASKEG